MNDAERKTREMADIEMILERFKHNINWDIIEEHFNLFGQQALLKELKEYYG